MKSPFNYIGGKYRELNQILPLFPDNINKFYDVFGGGGSVSLNVLAKEIIYNDIIPYVSDVLKELSQINYKDAIYKINYIINEYKLDKYNEIGFKKLRHDYNNGLKTWYMFYTLTCFSFNNQYRFNNKHEYNSSFGKYKSCFSQVTKNKLQLAIERLHKINIKFQSSDFTNIRYDEIEKTDFVYFDPPYLISCGNYNDGKRGFNGWNQVDDINLMNICDFLNEKNIKFALSNIFKCKNIENIKLINWSKKYHIHIIHNSYGNCNYQKKYKYDHDIEVLITNY